MTWLLILSSYFVAAVALAVGARRLGRAVVAVAIAPFLLHLGAVLWRVSGGLSLAEVEGVEWVPALGLSISFRFDAVTMLLSGLVAAVGALIVIYSAQYFGGGVKLARFVALLALFTGGMAGIVAADDLFGLFVFWEITTAASYLLIGFDHEKASARAAALQAVLVTAAGGLAMLAGFVMLAIESGTTSMTQLAADPPQGTVVGVALVLVFIGAFTKSAQFPFHFWLPGAMAAPTPASAYLHSATMVKAGVVLLIVLAPAFASAAVWGPVVTTVGMVTMFVGGVAAVGQRDLKLLLAHSTVSQLGFMVALVGLNQIAAAVAVLVSHALFKAGLFLVVGAVDKATGTRLIGDLAGLRSRAPLLATVGALLTLSMIGMPPLLGFVAKEAAFDVLVAEGSYAVLAIMAIASVITVVYSVRFWFGAFGKQVDPNAVAVKPSPLVATPALLAILSVAFGVLPGWLATVVEQGTLQKVKLVLWPGLTPALFVSVAVLAVGSMVSVRHSRLSEATWWRGATAASVYRAALRGLNRVADISTGVLQNGSLPVYIAVIVATVVTVPTVVWLVGWDADLSLRITNGPAELALGVAVIVAAVGVAQAKRRLSAVLLLGTVGYSVAGIYVAFGAPDLALTQLLVETLTVALFALVLVKLPRRFGADPDSLSKRIRLAVAAGVGLFATLAAVVISSVDSPNDVAEAYIANSEAAGGKNVVNVILTNFRALDTLGEITVLAAAALGISALVFAGRRRETEMS